MRLSIQKTQKHSEVIEEVEILGGYKLKIRPISAAQLDFLSPFLKRLFKRGKDINREKKIEDGFFDAFIECILDKETLQDTRQIIYSILDRPGIKIIAPVKLIGRVYENNEALDLFTFEDFNNNLPLDDLVKIAKVIWNQNTNTIFNLFEKINEKDKDKEETKEEEKTEDPK